MNPRSHHLFNPVWKITHYAIRDLHAQFPDDEREPAFDVFAMDGYNSIFYSEAVFASEKDAQRFIAYCIRGKVPREYWEDYVISPEYVRGLTWFCAKEFSDEELAELCHRRGRPRPSDRIGAMIPNERRT